MREAMARAEVGDDVLGDDPTVARLEHTIAELLGKEAAVFMPSGTMSNQVALLTHCERGDEVIVGVGAHLAWYESGAGAALAGVQFQSVGQGGTFTADDVLAAVKPEREYHPRTRLVALENTHNQSGGRVFPQQAVLAIADVAERHGLALHLDGARLWNASVASGLSPRELSEPFATVTVAFSKGLGAPVGSALSGSRALVTRARRFRKMLGGGMRQAGVLAAAALYALEHHRDRIALDHEHARLLAVELEKAGYGVSPEQVETNIVVVECPGGAEPIVERAAAHGVLVGALDARRLRLVTHLDVDREDVLTAARVLAMALDPAERQ